MQALVECSEGEKYQFVSFTDSFTEDKHLRNLGFVKLSPVEVISKNSEGFIVKVKEARVTIPKDIAEKIQVDEVSDIADYRFLNEIEVGSTVKTVGVVGNGAPKRRLMDMGITKGTDIQVVKVAPLGDPVEITVRGYQLSLRKSEAALILVKDKM